MQPTEMGWTLALGLALGLAAMYLGVRLERRRRQVMRRRWEATEMVRRWVDARPFCVHDTVRVGERHGEVLGVSPSGRLLTVLYPPNVLVLVDARDAVRVVERAA